MFHKNIADVASFVAGDATVLKEVLHPRHEGIDLPYSLAQAHLEPGKSSHPHVLTESEELYIFLEGTGEAILNGEVKQVVAGDLVLMPAGCEQYVRNTGKSPLVFYCIVSPPWSEGQERVRTD